MKMIADPISTLCPMKATGTYFHMFWESSPVARFWEMVASNLSDMFEISVPHSPVILILNGLSNLGLTLIIKRALLAGLTAAKKLISTCWKHPIPSLFKCGF